MPLLFPCRNALYAILPWCLPEPGVQVNIGLTTLSTYRYMLLTPYGKVYSAQITTGADGGFLFDFGAAPRDMLNPWLKLFQLTFYLVGESGNLACEPATFELCGQTYDTIVIRFVDSDELPAVIGCGCSEP